MLEIHFGKHNVIRFSVLCHLSHILIWSNQFGIRHFFGVCRRRSCCRANRSPSTYCRECFVMLSLPFFLIMIRRSLYNDLVSSFCVCPFRSSVFSYSFILLVGWLFGQRNMGRMVCMSVHTELCVGENEIDLTEWTAATPCDMYQEVFFFVLATGNDWLILLWLCCASCWCFQPAHCHVMLSSRASNSFSGGTKLDTFHALC